MPSTSQPEPEVSRSSSDFSSKPAEGLDLINALSDYDLLSIFKHLPPYERLLVSEVCKRWLAISRKTWTDVAHLDLSPIPGPNIAAIIKQCPKLSGILAVRKFFDLNELQSLPLTNSSALKLYDCAAAMRATGSETMDPLSNIFACNLRTGTVSWEELVLHNLNINLQDTNVGPWLASYFHARLPLSLRRLQITGKQAVDNGERSCSIEYGRGISQLTQLECLILRQTLRDDITWMSFKWLRELYISDECGRNFKGFLARLPKLEVLFVNNFRRNFDLSETTKHPSLRILVLTGYFGRQVEFPTRPLYANFNTTDPMPKLHIFVGRQASRMILFPKFLPNAAKAYPITEPLPQFLGRADIKPIFQGVWIAEKIREAASHCSELFGYQEDVAVSLRALDA